jgi:diaminopimelate epimerase
VRVETVNNVLELHLRDDGRVTVDMNRRCSSTPRMPFDAAA